VRLRQEESRTTAEARGKNTNAETALSKQGRILELSGLEYAAKRINLRLH
jgi:hypothetical protein